MKALDISPSLGGEKDFMNDYVTVTLNGFLLNAGVVGLIKMFEFARNLDNCICNEGVEYKIDGQCLYISRKFLLNYDLADLYIRSTVHYLGNDTKFAHVMSKKQSLDNLYKEKDKLSVSWVEKADKFFEEFIKMLEKPSFKSGYDILSKYTNIVSPNSEMVMELKKEKDYELKKKLYDGLHNVLENKKVYKVLTFKELMYSKIDMFIEGVSFFNKANSKNDITESYRECFVIPLIEELKSTKKKNKYCIDCGEMASKVMSMSFLKDVTDDPNRKKSYYWNCNPDAYLCPLCYFVYSFAPLGFHYLGNDAVFINNNSNIRSLVASKATLQAKSADNDEKNSWFKLYNLFTSIETEQLSKRVDNVQIIIRENKLDKNKSNKNKIHKYILNNVDKQIVEILDICKSQLNYLKNRYIKDDLVYINIYQKVIENIVNHRSLYSLITRLIQISFKNDVDLICALKILQIEIKRKGGQRMDKSIKRSYAAMHLGNNMRKSITVNVADKDNKLRGLVYQLLNAVSLGNRDAFMNIILRTYSGYGKPVPNIFFNCFKGDESFKEIGFAYILGLKCELKKKKRRSKLSVIRINYHNNIRSGKC